MNIYKSNKKTVPMIIITLTIIAGIIVLLFLNFSNSTNSLAKKQDNKTEAEKKENLSVSAEPDATTMKEAISIGLSQAQKWSRNAKLIKIISTDGIDDPTEKSGIDGKRNTWNLYFTDTQSQKQLQLYVSKRKIDSYVDDAQYGDLPAIDYANIKIDSDKALDLAIKEKALKPGKDWAVGYHFILNYVEDKLIITVIGLSPNGNFAHVNIDEETGKIIDASEKIYDEEGNATWVNF